MYKDLLAPIFVQICTIAISEYQLEHFGEMEHVLGYKMVQIFEKLEDHLVSFSSLLFNHLIALDF